MSTKEPYYFLVVRGPDVRLIPYNNPSLPVFCRDALNRNWSVSRERLEPTTFSRLVHFGWKPDEIKEVSKEDFWTYFL